MCEYDAKKKQRLRGNDKRSREFANSVDEVAASGRDRLAYCRPGIKYLVKNHIAV